MSYVTSYQRSCFLTWNRQEICQEEKTRCISRWKFLGILSAPGHRIRWLPETTKGNYIPYNCSKSTFCIKHHLRHKPPPSKPCSARTTRPPSPFAQSLGNKYPSIQRIPKNHPHEANNRNTQQALESAGDKI